MLGPVDEIRSNKEGTMDRMIRVQWTLVWERTLVDGTWHAFEKLI